MNTNLVASNDRKLFWRPEVWNQDVAGLCSCQELWENGFFASCHFWWLQAFVGWWLHGSNLCLCGPMPPPLVSVSFLCVSLIRTFLTGFRACLGSSGWSSHLKIFGLITCSPLFQIKSHLQCQWIRMWTSLWLGAGGTIHATTGSKPGDLIKRKGNWVRSHVEIPGPPP